MKRLIMAVIGVGVLVVGVGWHLNRPTMRAVSPTEPVTETIPAPAGDAPQAVEPVTAQPEPPAQPAEAPRFAKATFSTAAAPANPALEAASVSRTVDVLVSPQASYQQKQEAWKQLREAGKLDKAITELEQRTANDPRNADNPAALGHAYLQKCGTIQDLREQGILAMQADKQFDTALSLDSSNWEARFMKAVAMSYWPPMLNKGDEVIQNFQILIQQQEAQSPQPHFADTYAWLGDQYQKAGRADDARAVWQRGATLFPADEKLQTKLASKP
jgi:tetratricopeptide (TPR) repeat protein